MVVFMVFHINLYKSPKNRRFMDHPNIYIKHHQEGHGGLPPEYMEREKFICEQCPAGTFSTQGSTTCTDCVAGEYAPDGSNRPWWSWLHTSWLGEWHEPRLCRSANPWESISDLAHQRKRGTDKGRASCCCQCQILSQKRAKEEVLKATR